MVLKQSKVMFLHVQSGFKSTAWNAPVPAMVQMQFVSWFVGSNSRFPSLVFTGFKTLQETNINSFVSVMAIQFAGSAIGAWQGKGLIVPALLTTVTWAQLQHGGWQTFLTKHTESLINLPYPLGWECLASTSWLLAMILCITFTSALPVTFVHQVLRFRSEFSPNTYKWSVFPQRVWFGLFRKYGSDIPKTSKIQ